MFETKMFDMVIFSGYAIAMKTLKQLVAYLRKRDYSQERIARIAGVSQMTISRWEKENPTNVNIKAMRKLEKEVEALK